GAYTSFAFGQFVGTGQHALLHTMRYSAANSPNEYRWLSPSVVVICATRRICDLRRPAGNGTRPQGIGVGPPGAQPSGWLSGSSAWAATRFLRSTGIVSSGIDSL